MSTMRGVLVTVYVVMSGRYDQSVVLVAESVAVAVAALKQIYGAPHVVKWSDVRLEDGAYVISGEFSCVPHYSTEHMTQFDIVPYKLHSSD